MSRFQGKYIKYGSLISSPLGSGSYVWNGIKFIVPLLKSGSCYVPHVSSSLAIYFSPWIPIVKNFIPTPQVPGLVDHRPLAIYDLIHPASITLKLSLL